MAVRHRRGDPRGGRAPPREPPLLHPRRLAPHPRSRHQQVRPREPARARHRHLGDADRADPRAQGALPGHPHAHLLRIHRSRLRRLARRRGRAAQARQRGAALARRRPEAHGGRRDLRAQRLPDGRLLRRSGGDGRGARATAGSTPATSARFDDDGYLSIVGPPEGADPQRRREHRARRGGGGAARPPGGGGDRGDRPARCAVGRDRVRRGGAGAGRLARAGGAPEALLRRRLAGFKKPAPARAGRLRCRGRRRPARCSARCWRCSWPPGPQAPADAARKPCAC